MSTMSFSTRPDTLNYADLSSNAISSDEDRGPTRYDGRTSHRSPQKRVTISEQREVFPQQSATHELRLHNAILSDENELLREQLHLREEALRLHGVNILGDVIHLLDQQHIGLAARQPSAASHQNSALAEERRAHAPYHDRHKSERILHSPYEKELLDSHRYLANLGRGDERREYTYSNTEHRSHRRSSSIDSDDIDVRLEKSCTAEKNIGKPKHTSTPYTKRNKSRSKSTTRNREANCNVNARHPSPEKRRCSRLENEIKVLDLESLRVDSEKMLESSYFPPDKESLAKRSREQKRNMRKLDLLAHWEECENRHLHVAPAKPPTKFTRRKPGASAKHRSKSIDRKLHSKKVDLNKTYTVNKDCGRSIYRNAEAEVCEPTILTAGKLTKTGTKSTNTPRIHTEEPPQKSASVHKSTSTSALDIPPTEVQHSPSKNKGQLAHAVRDVSSSSQEDRHMGTSDYIAKLSLLESSNARLLGEIAFQLDKRILSFVLNGKFNRECKYKSFYGYNVVNLQQRIIERETGELKEVMLDRYRFLLRTLDSIGYEFPNHSNFAVMLVNKHGVMKHTKSDIKNITVHVQDEGLVRDLVRRVASPQEVKDTLILLQCLTVMAADDGMPLFIW